MTSLSFKLPIKIELAINESSQQQESKHKYKMLEMYGKPRQIDSTVATYL